MHDVGEGIALVLVPEGPRIVQISVALEYATYTHLAQPLVASSARYDLAP